MTTKLEKRVERLEAVFRTMYLGQKDTQDALQYLRDQFKSDD